MTPMVRRYATYIIDQTKGPVLDLKSTMPFLGEEAAAIANDHIEILEKRGMLFELIWSSNDIDDAFIGDVDLEEWTNDPKVMVRRVAFLCLQQAVADLMAVSSVS